MIGRLVHTADFRRLLRCVPRCRSAHFALHHAACAPGIADEAEPKPPTRDLSTEHEQTWTTAVDNSAVAGHWLGIVVPKKQARRAPTRNLIKRQAREALRRHAPTLAPGLWLLRLRQGYDAGAFGSAVSPRLRHAVREELDGLFARAATRQ